MAEPIMFKLKTGGRVFYNMIYDYFTGWFVPKIARGQVPSSKESRTLIKFINPMPWQFCGGIFGQGYINKRLASSFFLTWLF